MKYLFHTQKSCQFWTLRTQIHYQEGWMAPVLLSNFKGCPGIRSTLSYEGPGFRGCEMRLKFFVSHDWERWVKLSFSWLNPWEIFLVHFQIFQTNPNLLLFSIVTQQCCGNHIWALHSMLSEKVKWVKISSNVPSNSHYIHFPKKHICAHCKYLCV